MLPTLTIQGEWFALDKRKRRGRGIAVGDLVIYKIPMSPNQSGIKRVVGMPGDYVSLGTPGERGDDQMIQVWFSCVLTFSMSSHVLLTNFRCPRVIAGLWGITCRLLGTLEHSVRFRWPWCKPRLWVDYCPGTSKRGSQAVCSR